MIVVRSSPQSIGKKMDICFSKIGDILL